MACLFATSCDQGFDEINTNKVDPTSLAPSLVLNKAIISTTYLDGFGTLGILCYNFGIVQQIITPYGSSLSGGNYNQINNSNTPLVWVNFYRNVIKQLVSVIDIYNSARIWRAYAFMILTDTYGDVPYFEAGQGYTTEIITPKYDPQQAIYKDILKELDEASAKLDPAQAAVVTDILYGGNVPRVFQSNADNSVIRHTAIYNNYIANHLAAREKTNFYLTAPFVNYLKTNSDPRLPVFAVRYVGAKGGTEQVAARATSVPSVQIGMPMGYNDVTITSTLQANGVASLWDYSQVNLSTVLKLDAPEFHVTYSETLLLLAEAAHRGWTTGSAADFYAKGIRANMEQMALYDASATIKETDIVAYLAAHPFDAAKALELINTQYWVATFLDGNESWANLRRSGFPALQRNPYPGSEIKGDFIRRLPYPDSEIVVNSGNLNEAIGRQGANNLDTRMWWDK